MMDKLLPAIIVAIFSGPAFLACKHPDAFRRLFTPLYLLGGITMGAMFLWNGSVAFTHSRLLVFINNRSVSDAATVANDIRAPWWAISLAIAFLVFLLFLDHLTKLIKEKPVDKD